MRVKHRRLGTGAMSKSFKDLEMIVCIWPLKKRHLEGACAPGCSSNSVKAAFNCMNMSCYVSAIIMT